MLPRIGPFAVGSSERQSGTSQLEQSNCAASAAQQVALEIEIGGVQTTGCPLYPPRSQHELRRPRRHSSDHAAHRVSHGSKTGGVQQGQLNLRQRQGRGNETRVGLERSGVVRRRALQCSKPHATAQP
jgi:hypothetical protein